MKRSFIQKILFYLSVPKCVCCSERLDIDDGGLCKRCAAEYSEVKMRNCSRCARILSECTCSNKFLEKHHVKRLIKVYRYVQHHENVASNSLIYSLKRDNRGDVLDLLSSELETAVRNSIENPSDFIVTNVPRRRKAIKKYGIDHAKLLAVALARRLGCEYRSLLISKSKRPQKSMHGEERIGNAEFKIKRVSLKSKRIILVDDIATTGASLGACAELLHSVGARETVGAVISVAYKDEYTPFAFVPPIF